jgi:hypothetical protein
MDAVQCTKDLDNKYHYQINLYDLKTGNQIVEFWNSYACIAEENLARTNSGRERRVLNTIITLCIC